MRGFLILLSRELLTTFTSFGYYMLLSVVAAVTSFLFLEQLKFQGFSVAGALHGSAFWLYILTMALAPLLTMRLLAEEKRSGSLELLMTAPVGDFQVVFAKFVGAVIVFATFMTPIWIAHVLLAWGYAGDVDWGQLSATTLGVVSVALVYLSLGTLASALTQVQLWSALLAFMGNLFVVLVGRFQFQFEEGSVPARIFAYVDLQRHMQTSVLGLIDLRHITFQLSVTALFLYWTVRLVEARKWK